MLHYEQVFNNVFQRTESKCSAVLMKHCYKVKGEQVITLQIAQQLETIKISMHQDNCFVASVKLCFCQRQIHCIDDQDKFQSVTDTDNGFSECQTQRKQLQSIGLSSASLQALIKNLKSNISELYKVQVDCLKDSGSDSYDKK